jgi:hypothetical protein
MTVIYDTNSRQHLTVIGSGSYSGAGSAAYDPVGSFTTGGDIEDGLIRITVFMNSAASGANGIGLGNDNTGADIFYAPTSADHVITWTLVKSVATPTSTNLTYVARYATTTGGGSNVLENATFDLSANETLWLFVKVAAAVNYNVRWIAELVKP